MKRDAVVSPDNCAPETTLIAARRLFDSLESVRGTKAGWVAFGPQADNQHRPWPQSTAAHEAVIMAGIFFGSACQHWRIRIWRKPVLDCLPRSL